MAKREKGGKGRGPEITNGPKETRDLPVKLSDEEINDLGRKLPVVMEEMDRIEDEKKNVVADYGGRLKRKKTEAETIAREIRTKERVVPVELQWRYVWPENRKSLVRLDTEEVVDSMAIQEVERQQHFKGLKVVEKPKDEKPDPEPEGKKDDEPPKQGGPEPGGGE
jgi:hypothetical protein